jgi:hydrophobe/amphiphile efflux-1 (HAE1) family protein
VISYFFIDRPIFATVLSIIIVLAGGVSFLSLPVALYPEIAPPTIQVMASYPGANAQIVQDTVAAPIEQQVNGVENMLYMSSQSTNDGAYTLTVTFNLDTDLNMAQVLVQNRVALAMPQLPSLVQSQGVSVKKKSPSTMMIVNLFADDNAKNVTELEISNYATIQIRDQLARLPGVGDVTYIGQRDYSMRIWLDPEALAARGLSANDVVNAVKEQNVQVAAGQIGQPPAPKGQSFQFTITTKGRLIDKTEFEDIILKIGHPDGDPQATSVLRLRDVGRVELGAQQYDQKCWFNDKPSVALSIFQLPGSNAVTTADQVRQKMKLDIGPGLTASGLNYEIAYNTTPFIDESILDVKLALRDAIILVGLVVLVFLQSWRATLIPLAAVPVAIVGTFAAMLVLGFSLNTLTLFGLVLAVGIVVDDAIVVVENVERWLAQGLAPREAARKAMDEVTGPVVAVALVLCAVFVPCAFLGGITGQFFRQFAVTIAVSTLLSAFNSLTLSPALAALLLRPHSAKKDPLTRVLDLTLGWFFWLFNRGFDKATGVYVWVVGLSLRLSLVVLLIYGGLLALTYLAFVQAPEGFIPEADKGYLLVNVQLPDSAATQRTESFMFALQAIARQEPGVDKVITVSGQSLLLNANAPNFGSMYVVLKSFDDEPRRAHDLSSTNISSKLSARFRKEIQGAVINIYDAPPVDGLGNAGGFKVMIEDVGTQGLDKLQKTTDQVVAAASARAELRDVSTTTRFDTPWYYLEIDRTKCLSLGVSLTELFGALQTYLGSLYVNNFNAFGRSWQVNVQAESGFRSTAEEIQKIRVKNANGQMVPLGTLADVTEIGGPSMLLRYNMYSAAAITGVPGPNTSSKRAMQVMDEVWSDVKKKSPKMDKSWTELAKLQEQESGSQALVVFALAVVFVFLVLAGQYESWSLPLAVILVVPMCLLCAIAGVLLMQLDVNIFTQIGFVVLVGLASKNAILIVEFAKQQREEGKPRREATLEACRLRLRPILMTSFAFILGVVPLVTATGAGAEMRRTLGTAVFAGMLGVTLFGIFLTPVFFYVIQGVSDWLAPHRPPASEPPHTASPAIGEH